MKENSYLEPTNLYEEAQRRLNELVFVRKTLESRLRTYPAGKIHITRKGTGIQYYLRKNSKDKTGTYLSKKDERNIKIFLQKKYDETAIKQVNAEISSLEHFLKYSKSNSEKLQNLYSEYPLEIRKYINPIDSSDEEYINQWLSVPYVHKAISEELPVFLTSHEERVRSKSELNIANLLCKMNVPYKYECPLTLSDGRIIYPDFTLLDIRNRREVYWEHRGMMDDRGYLKHTVQRIKDYRKDGIYVGDNLIITEETASVPLGTDEIISVIKRFLK